MSDTIQNEAPQLEADRLHAEIRKMIADADAANAQAKKALAEAGKITRETVWYPAVMGATLLGTGGVVATLVGKFLSWYS